MGCFSYIAIFGDLQGFFELIEAVIAEGTVSARFEEPDWVTLFDG
jgi:hypothetical protein